MSRILLAAFPTAHEAIAAARVAFERGFAADDILSPNPLDEVTAYLAVAEKPKPIGWIMFAAGVVGAGFGYLMQWYSAVIDYPLLSGGRGLNSWPAFLIVPYETTILAASVTGTLCLIGLCGLPKLFHPVFAAAVTERAAQDHYVLVFRARPDVRELFESSLQPTTLEEIES
jgi:hypothetical protein